MLFGFLLLLAALGFSLISRAEEEQFAQKACLSCNGYFETIESQVTEVGPSCEFNLRIAYPNLKGRFPCFRVTYNVDDAEYFVESAERSVSIVRASKTLTVDTPQRLFDGDSIWTVVGTKRVHVKFHYLEG